MSLFLIAAAFYSAVVAILVWAFHDRYIEVTGTLRTHVINLALIVGVTLAVVLATWDLFTSLVAPAPGTWRGPVKYAMRVIGLYFVVPCGVFVARYCTVDTGGFERERWPAAVAGWAATALATWLLLLGALAR